MNKSAITDKVLCPYFKEEKGVFITCEGITFGSVSLKTNYGNLKNKFTQMDDFCCNLCWKGCPIKELIENK